jgi:spermidine synthase
MLSVWIQERSFDSLYAALGVQALALALCTLPTTAALGAWLPLLARRMPAAGGPSGAQALSGDSAREVERNPEGASPPGRAPAATPSAAALLYACNCLGAAVGAISAVAMAIPMAGTTSTLCLCAIGLLLLGSSLGPTPAQRRWLWLALPMACAAGWWLRDFPEPQRMLSASTPVGHQLYRYEDVLTLNHVTESADGQRTLLTDLQHMDASTDAAAVQIQADQARLPLLLHRDPHSILFLGLGTGISASGSLVYPQLERTAVELSPGAIAAARTWFAPANGHVLQSLQVQTDDARHYLMAQTRRFDVIVGDLFHPDLAGMGNLLSVQQFERARAHLNPDGVFAQWLALNQFDRQSLRTVLRGFRQVFPNAVMFFDGMHLALIGSPTSQAYGANVAAHVSGLSEQQIDAQTGGEGPWTWLGRYCGPVDGGVGAVQSETHPVIEYRLPHLRYLDQAPLPELLLEMLRQRPALAAAQAQLAIAPTDQVAFANAYLGAQLAMQSDLAALDGDVVLAALRTRLAFEANPRDHWVASALADELFDKATAEHRLADRATLERILRVFPEHLESLRALWHLDQGSSATAAHDDLERLRALVPLDREVAAATS